MKLGGNKTGSSTQAGSFRHRKVDEGGKIILKKVEEPWYGKRLNMVAIAS